METIETRELTITTVGADGAAVGSGTIEDLYGLLLDVYLNFHASAPNTTDTTIAYGSPALGNILVVSNSVTDALFAPRKAICDAAAAALALYDLYVLNGTLTISLAGCNALTGALVATVRYLKV